MWARVWMEMSDMAELRLIDRPPQVALGTRRAEVLDRLREAAGPLSVAQVAQATGLHVNTARFHLDGLVTDGLAERLSEERSTPGRPRILYAAAVDTTGSRSYGLLSEMLTGLAASLGGAGRAATAAGREWGRHLVERPAPLQRVDAAEATSRLHRVLDAIGFQPRVQAGTDGVEVRLHHCPFREVAERHADVVCAVHFGLMQGALGELRAPLEATSLEPFVAPSLCVARLRRPASGPPA